MADRIRYSSIETAFGEIIAVWREPTSIKIHRIILPHLKHTLEEDFPNAKKGDNKVILSLLKDIADFLEGKDVSFDLELMDFGICSDFQHKVLLAEYGIPRGRVSTYSRIAKHIGSPKASRAVGNSLAKNPFPLIIPCHRAVRSDGSLGGYQGGVDMKRRLLEMEGVTFHKDRVDISNLFY